MNFVDKIHIRIRIGISLHEIKTEEKILENSEIPAQSLNKERNLCTYLNKPIRLH